MLNPLNMSDTYYNFTRARLTGRRVDGVLRSGRNLTECVDEWKGVEKVNEACQGEHRVLGWWRDEPEDDGLDTSGWAGMSTSSREMVSHQTDSSLELMAVPDQMAERTLGPKSHFNREYHRDEDDQVSHRW